MHTTWWAAGILMPAFFSLGFSSCIGEGCIDNPLTVNLEANPLTGQAPLTVELTAEGYGRSCGCCSGQSSEIVEYRWDLDGDGTIDVQGETETTLTHTFSDPGEYIVTVEVLDTRAMTASDGVTIVVTE